MRAAVIREIGAGFEIESVDVSQPIGAEVLVEVRAAGLCHSDYSLATIDRGRPLPMVVGHEMAGVVTAVGPDARDFAVGDHVIGTQIQACGACALCTSGKPYQCARPGALDRSPDAGPRLTAEGEPLATFGLGAFAEYALVHQNQLVRVPKEIPFAQAAIMGCATATGVGSVLNAAKVQPGESVVVIGLGGVGLNVLSGAHIAGAREIIGIDLQPDKLELAKRFGVTHALSGDDPELAEKVREITGGGAHHAFEVIGFAQTQRQAIDSTRVGGAVHFIGIPRTNPFELSVMADLLAGQRSLNGVYMGSSDMRKDIPFYCDLYLQGRLNLDDLIAQEIALEDINAAYEQQSSGAIARSVIRFT